MRVVLTDATVLISGESGTGKELVAKVIHANSLRADRPFVPVNCAAITETLLESELFGHARGAFTGAVAARKGLFEEADGGTFFFDEISETTQPFQAKLLRAIEQGEVRPVGENRTQKVDVRIIAATNTDIRQEVAEGRFREDLFYRLNVARLIIPPLRERSEDIVVLFDFFFEKFKRKHKRMLRVAPGVVEALMRHDFPGNVRELENLVEQAVALAPTDEVTMADLMSEDDVGGPRAAGRTLQEIVDQAERSAIEASLCEVGGN
ncbi:sigma-54-dependent Fis family transcriptional regulator [Endomicrobium sp. AH-315-J14]|nr:sigma-54-dependent Fis family transcriptional regulator [Endomicrobium sp. AH-315-J14]